MVTTESVTIKVPVGMSKYLVTMTPETELTRSTITLSLYIKSDNISWSGCRDTGYQKIGADRSV